MSHLLFIGDNGAAGPTVWVSDGTASGTKPINASVPVFGNLPGEPLGIPGGRYLLSAYAKIYTQSSSNSLLIWDTHDSSDIHNWTAKSVGPQQLSPQGFTAYNGQVFFNGSSLGGALEGQSQDLFSTGAAQTITQITTSGVNPSSLAVAFGKLYYSGNSGDTDSHGNPIKVLFAYDGSSNGPQQVQGVDIVNPDHLMPPVHGLQGGMSGQLWMSGQDSAGGPTWLYGYDGQSLRKIAPTSTTGGIATPAASGGLRPYNIAGSLALFFSGVNAAGERGLWATFGYSEETFEVPVIAADGTTIKDPNPYNLTVFKDQLYFTARDTNSHGDFGSRGLFVCYPPTCNTSEIIPSFLQSSSHSASDSVLDLDPSTFYNSKGALNQTTMTVYDNKLYFSAWQPNGGEASTNNLWRTGSDVNDWPASARPVNSIGSNSLHPWSLTTT
jgi:ELWxxDGT repeat protein